MILKNIINLLTHLEQIVSILKLESNNVVIIKNGNKIIENSKRNIFNFKIDKIRI